MPGKDRLEQPAIQVEIRLHPSKKQNTNFQAGPIIIIIITYSLLPEAQVSELSPDDQVQEVEVKDDISQAQHLGKEKYLIFKLSMFLLLFTLFLYEILSLCIRLNYTQFTISVITVNSSSSLKENSIINMSKCMQRTERYKGTVWFFISFLLICTVLHYSWSAANNFLFPLLHTEQSSTYSSFQLNGL